MTGAGPEASTPDHVHTFLRAAGYTGSMDDMWQQHLTALGITDTAEPFTTSLALGTDWSPTPDNYTLQETWSDGGANNLAPLLAGMTTNRIDSFDISPDGSFICMSNRSDNTASAHQLTTPFDFSASTQRSTNRTISNTVGIRYVNSGTQWAVAGMTDFVYVLNVDSTAYYIETGDLLDTGAEDIELGADSVQDGTYAFNADGTAIYWMVDITNNATIAKAVLGTPWNMDSIGAITTLNINGTFPNLDKFTQCIHVSDAEEWMLFLDSETLYLGTFGTAGDVTTITFDTVNTLDLTGLTGAITSFWVSQDGETLYVNSSTAAAPRLYKYTR
jgi:hypothetical protein